METWLGRGESPIVYGGWRDIMRRHPFCWIGILAALLLVRAPLSGQLTREILSSPSPDSRGGEPRLGFPQDWSSRQLVMPGLRTEDALEAGKRDPRYVY